LIYIDTKYKLLCIDKNGTVKYKMTSKNNSSAISVIAQGEMSFIASGVLHIFN